MTFVLSLELVKTYECFFPLVDALRSFRVSRGGGTYVPPPGRAKVAQTPGRARVKPQFLGYWDCSWDLEV